MPQSPGGVANIEPADVLTRVQSADLLGDLDFIPHVSCKDHNNDAIASSLVDFRAKGIESVLALTGDKPVRSRGVFEFESVNLLKFIQDMNDAAYLKAGLARLGLDTGRTETPIVPVMLGDVKLAKDFSARLFENGVFAMALGFPTVPQGQARIRVMNTAAHSREDLDAGLAAFEKTARQLGVL